jgi:hypothetical protein
VGTGRLGIALFPCRRRRKSKHRGVPCSVMENVPTSTAMSPECVR